MGYMKEIDIEIKNSRALSYLWHEIQANRTALDSTLQQKSKDWELLQEVKKLTVDKRDLKDIASAREAIDEIDAINADVDKKPKKKSKSKDSSFVRLIASMLFVAFMLASMAAMTVVNDMIDGFNKYHGVILSFLFIIMITTSIVIYAMFYYEREHKEEKTSESELSDMLRETDRIFSDTMNERLKIITSEIIDNRTEIRTINEELTELSNDVKWIKNHPTFSER